jgi:branched-chain amino acid aminotransferase
MPKSDSVPVAYLNGHFLPAGEAGLSLQDAGFVWGATATDRVRTYGHKLYLFSEHLERFRTSCELCSIPQPVPDDELTRIAERLAGLNAALLGPKVELILIMFATPGPCRPGKPAATPTLGMHAIPLEGELYRSLITQGAKLIVPEVRHLPVECVPRQAKMRSRMHWWLAEQQARETDPDAAALLRDRAGHITETASANFLIVRKGVVISPPRDQVLDGISLLVIEELCGTLGIKFEEHSIKIEDCQSASEAMLASTPYGVAGVSSINGISLSWPGPILKRLHKAWSDRVGVDIWRHILPNH